MIDNPCIKCRWYRCSSPPWSSEWCNKGGMVDDAVYGSVWKLDYPEELDLREVREHHCRGRWFEPNVWERIKRRLF